MNIFAVSSHIRRFLLGAAAILSISSAFAASSWWDKDWSGRKPFTVDTTAEGGAIKDEIGTAVVLVRLHQGNFPFEASREDGSDLRFVSGDDKTPLPFHVEKWDPLMLEGIVWVQVPDVTPDGKTNFWLYYGNAEPSAETAGDPAKTHPKGTVLVYHFAERNTPPKDVTANGNAASSAGTISEGSLIGAGMRLLGADPIEIPASSSLEWTSGQDWSWSAWVKSSGPVANAVILSRSEGNSALRIGLNEAVPYVEVVNGDQTQGTTTGDPVTISSWTRLEVVASGGNITLFVNGTEYGSVSALLPAMSTPYYLGGDAAASGSSNGRFIGEIDEMQIAKAATPPGGIAFTALNQSGAEAAGKLLVPGEDEGGHASGGHGGALEHVMLFGDIANNMMFDGWIAVVVCIIMMIAGGIVAFQKFVGLGKIEKGNDEFQKLWIDVASDLTSMDLDDPKAAKDFKGKIGKKAVRLLKDSPLYHVYHVGADEISKRLGHGKNKGQGLSARSIQAIRASLDAALVHEMHRLNKNLVYLTVSIAGGPYVGLLGTVVGVMITFAIIAKSGEVDVNSIAPGIASALLATTVGLLVAIPALFLYSFLNTRIKKVIATMQVFIDEFVAKIAEFYPPPSEAFLPVPIRQIRSPEEAIRNEENEAVDEEIRDEINS
jgi:biopolymer transport protein ExbB